MELTRHVGLPVRRPLNRRAFTLVEILIVVAILGILAAIVIPQFVSATTESKINSVRMDINRIRTQIQVYQQQHGDWPTLASIASQLTLSSKADGSTATVGTVGYPLGPYIMDMPVNPLSGGVTVGNGAPGTSDWYYDETSGDFRANDSELSRTY